MSDTVVDDWSPADHPYSIAVSEAQWWRRTAALAVRRIHAGDEGGGFDSRQIDARQLCVALCQLLTAEKLQQIALDELGIAPAAVRALEQARERFEAALPDIKHMRDGLTHFEDWSRGKGRGPQKERIKAGETPRDVARAFWGFGYDPTTDTISLGPFHIDVGAVDQAAGELAHAIYVAAHEVDKKNTAKLHATVVQALASGGILCVPNGPVQVVAGDDCRVWLSIPHGTDNELERQELATRVVTVLADTVLRLSASTSLQPADMEMRLTGGESLRIEPGTAA
ncbi:hypothetical protein [Streptomyces sp. NPDC086519]|uniref:hypothetical protein n=1 Tax=Streptomyces sp. NPDC086519 TaxID=3154863 RepID=UPI003434A9A2